MERRGGGGGGAVVAVVVVFDLSTSVTIDVEAVVTGSAEGRAFERPSAMASAAPTPQAISDCGPPSVARIAGTVMNGPVPTMFDMLMDRAFNRPSRRGNLAWACPDCEAAVATSILKRKPS